MALSPNMNVMIRAVEKAAKSLVRDFGEVEQLQVSRKGPGDFVSAADLRSEQIIFEDLSKARPDYAFLMEERGGGGAADAEYRWIVDPLDGTTNFLHGIPHWNITIALEHKGEIVAGIVHDPIKNETFRAEKNMGAFIKNKRLRVSGRTSIAEAVLATGIPSLRKSKQHQTHMTQIQDLAYQTAGIRRMGSAALDLAYVAAGRFEAYWEYGCGAWDLAAGMLIVREAGGIATDIDSIESPVKTGAILASNPSLYGDIRKVLQSAGRNQDAA